MAVKDYTKFANGYELRFTSNHLGHFLLANLLAEKLFAAAEGARIVNVTSDGCCSEGIRLELLCNPL